MQLQKILKNDDYLQISIFRHKTEFFILRKNIESSVQYLTCINLILLGILGIFPATFFLVNVFLNMPNFYILLAMRIQPQFQHDA